MKKVKAADIYKDIMDKNGIREDARESYVRNLRNKMAFLLEQVALGKRSDFKDGRNVMIPECDAPIVRNLIMASIDDDYPAIIDWFNGAVDLNDAEKCILVFMAVKEPIMRSEMTGETDSVTVDEWIAVIGGILNINMAEGTVRLKRKLEDFRVRTLVKDSTVGVGDVIAADEDGNRWYALKGDRPKKTISDEVLANIVEGLNFQDDYFSVMEQIMDYMIADAEKKAIPEIETYAMAKELSGASSAKEMIMPEGESMVSDYIPWIKKIGRFLRDNPEKAKEIEESSGTSGLAGFFGVSGQ